MKVLFTVSLVAAMAMTAVVALMSVLRSVDEGMEGFFYE